MLYKENKIIKLSEDKLKLENSQLRGDKEKFEDKYRKNKQIKDELIKKCNEMDLQIKTLLMEKDINMLEKHRDEQSKKVKAESKQKVSSLFIISNIDNRGYA